MNSALDVFACVRCYLKDLQATQTFDPDEYELLLGLVRNRSFEKLASCRDLFPTALSRGKQFYAALLQIEAFFKKNADFAKPQVTLAAARASFLDAEAACKETNLRLEKFFFDGEFHQFGEYISRAQRRISDVLGSFRLFLDTMPENIRVTAGATSTRSKKQSVPWMKISMKPISSSGAAPYIKLLGQHMCYRVKPKIKAAFNRVTFVAKNWKTQRTIACEHEGNLVLQLAFDTYAKSRLRKVGIDLSDQSLNKSAACSGSLQSGKATLDLKQASDTVSYNLVYLLFPYPWAKYLDDIRAVFGLLDGEYIPYSKFSSMGNGSTFTIETLLFEALCYSLGSRDHLIYGDDIIIDTRFVESLVELLEFCGFTINKEKSFTSGPFRESCGGNYFLGADITPYYHKGGNGVTSIYHAVNNMVKIALPYGNLWAYLKTVVKRLPAGRSHFVPVSENTRAGIFVDAPTCYANGVLERVPKSCAGHLRYKALMPKTQLTPCHDSRALFLWYLSRKREFVPDRQWLAFFLTRKSEATRSLNPRKSYGYASGSIGYRRQWCVYRVAGPPDYIINMWSNYVTSKDVA